MKLTRIYNIIRIKTQHNTTQPKEKKHAKMQSAYKNSLSHQWFAMPDRGFDVQ